jgi:hypothetical protein
MRRVYRIISKVAGVASAYLRETLRQGRGRCCGPPNAGRPAPSPQNGRFLPTALFCGDEAA